jgi:hypothetical protein
MKRLTGLALPGALTAITGAYAGERLIAEDQGGGKVTIDTDSVHQSGSYVQAGLGAYSGDDRIALIAMVEGCDQGHGGIRYKADPTNPATPLKVALWTSSGEQITDKMAVAACQHANNG